LAALLVVKSLLQVAELVGPVLQEALLGAQELGQLPSGVSSEVEDEIEDTRSPLE
jgi:hypothetical protein